jgi:hypothetical protein
MGGIRFFMVAPACRIEADQPQRSKAGRAIDLPAGLASLKSLACCVKR